MRGSKVLLLLDEMDSLVAKAENSSEDTIPFFNFLRSSFNQGSIKMVITGFRHVNRGETIAYECGVDLIRKKSIKT